MRTVRVQLDGTRDVGYLVAANVTAIAKQGDKTYVYTTDGDYIVLREDTDELARRIEAALAAESDPTVEVGKDGEPVDGNITIRLSEYRALLRNFYRGGVEDELKKIRERLAKLEGGAE